MISQHDFNDLVATATEFIRSEGHRCVVSIDELLDELSDRLPLSEDTCTLLNLIVQLWDNPRIDQIPNGGIEFAWNENG